MPPLPNDVSSDSSIELEEYNGNSSLWYLSAQKSMSDALVTLSPACWDSIYLQNEEAVGPVIEQPPECNKYSEDIVESLNTYLAEVKNVS